MKPIKDYEDYQITEDGKVGSDKSNKGLLQRLSKGYYDVGLGKDGKCKRFLVHRLVADAYIPNPNNWPQVNHKDEDKTNNSIDNLEWCTATYNTNYGTRNIRVEKKLSLPIIQCAPNGDEIKKWDSITSAARELDIFATNIVKCLKGKYKTAGGYGGKYA